MAVYFLQLGGVVSYLFVDKFRNTLLLLLLCCSAIFVVEWERPVGIHCSNLNNDYLVTFGIVLYLQRALSLLLLWGLDSSKSDFLEFVHRVSYHYFQFRFDD